MWNTVFSECGNMFDKNSVLTRKILVYAVSLFVAALLALYLTMYAIAAYMIARWIVLRNQVKYSGVEPRAPYSHGRKNTFHERLSQGILLLIAWRHSSEVVG